METTFKRKVFFSETCCWGRDIELKGAWFMLNNNAFASGMI